LEPARLNEMSDRVSRLLVVYQIRSGGTQLLVDAAVRGAVLALESGTGTLSVRHAFDATADDVLGASGVLIATPANFGYMSGAVKDFFERVYHPCLDHTVGKPYAMIIKGDTDVEGAASSIRRIVTGMKWREVLPPVLVVGEISPDQEDAAQELGATLAAGIDAGIY
jgi:multimeric flavodoxin WrbA